MKSTDQELPYEQRKAYALMKLTGGPQRALRQDPLRCGAHQQPGDHRLGRDHHPASAQPYRDRRTSQLLRHPQPPGAVPWPAVECDSLSPPLFQCGGILKILEQILTSMLL